MENGRRIAQKYFSKHFDSKENDNMISTDYDPWYVFQCLQPAGRYIFGTPTTKTWDTHFS